MAPRGLLRIDELVSDHDLERPSPGWDDYHLIQMVFELGQNLLRQTDGSRRVASLSAVLD
jgi:hypothetical protein